MKPTAPAGAFPKTERFTQRSLLGHGAFGTVYEAYDNEREAVVALKILRRLDANSLLRFKREFRSLSNILHPHLVRFHELFSEDVLLVGSGARGAGTTSGSSGSASGSSAPGSAAAVSGRGLWFFTMEYVEGTDLLSFVRGTAPPRPSLALTGTATSPAISYREETETAAATRARAAGIFASAAAEETFPRIHAETRIEIRTGSLPPLPFEGSAEKRLRDAMQQVATGLAALHEHGRLHRDLKPSNVLVSTAGRVVIVDFGLVAELSGDGGEDWQVAGTPAYMAPEQAQTGPLAPSCDFYAMGVMLYEALAGRLPFEGSGLGVLISKRVHEARPLREVVPGVPRDLDLLCEDSCARIQPRGLAPRR